MNDAYRVFLMRLRAAVQRAVCADESLSLEAAYQRELPRLMMQDAESLDLSPFEARVLDTLDTLSPRDSSPPVPTKRACAELGMDYFALHYHLRKLEDRGLVSRPRGPRSGWKVSGF